MKSFAFALAAVASVAWSGSAMAQCKNCARSASPVASRTVVQPTYQLAPVAIASRHASSSSFSINGSPICTFGRFCSLPSVNSSEAIVAP